MEIKIYIRYRQLFDLFGNPIVAVASTPANVGWQHGIIPNNNWIDITEDCENVDDFSIEFTEQRNESGELNSQPGVSFLRKTSSGDVAITGDAYAYIKDYLFDRPESRFNTIAVKVEQVGCGAYEGLVMTRQTVTWCEDGVCRFDATVKQDDEVFHCIQKTVIADNWDGRFQEIPTNGRQYPRFSYCNEPSSAGWLAAQWIMGIQHTVISSMFVFMFATMINPILWLLNLVQNFLCNLGIACGWNPPSPISATAFSQMQAWMMLESAGCGREHPSPFLRDYIQNVCDKCGVHVDADTAPVFFATHMDIEKSTGMHYNAHNPYYNATWFEPKQKRGIRRNREVGVIGMVFLEVDPDTTTFFQPDNAPQWVLSDFLDILKKQFNSEWRVRTVNGKPTLFFLRKDLFASGAYVYSFAEGSPEREKIMQGVCFEPFEITSPAATGALYSTDDTDESSQETEDEYNGIFYNFGQLTDTNALFEGLVPKTPNNYISTTKFGQDGSSTDYVYDAFQMTVSSSFINLGPFLSINPLAPAIMNSILIDFADKVRKYVDHVIYLRNETVGMGRVLIWDGNDMLNARVWRDKRATPTPFSTKSDPKPNVIYNTRPFFDVHPRQLLVRGSLLANNSYIAGVYMVRNMFGVTYCMTPVELPNFPMYFNPGFEDTLWDWWWWIEDPRRFPKLGIRWSVGIENCCEDLRRLGVFSDNISELKLGHRVELPLKFIRDGKIESIKVDYGMSDGVGRLITLKGTV